MLLNEKESDYETNQKAQLLLVAAVLPYTCRMYRFNIIKTIDNWWLYNYLVV